MRSSRVARFFVFIACCASCTFVLPHHAGATSVTWSGAVDTNWSTPTGATNWVPGLPAASGDSLFFDDTGVGLTNTDDIAGLSVAGVTFNGTTNAYILNGTTPLTLTGGATALVTNSSVAQTVNLPLNFGVNATFTGGAGAASNLAIGGAVTNTAASGNLVLTLLGTGTITDNITNSSAATTQIAPNSATANWTVLDNATSTPITLASGLFNVINGTLNYGTATSAPNFTVTAVPSDHTVGNASSTGTFNMVNGTLLLKTRLNTVNGIVNISGGNIQIWNQFQISNGAQANVSTVNVTGGLLDQRNSTGVSSGGTIFVASRGAGTLTISGTGSVICNTLDVSRGAAAAVGGVASQGIVNLNAGGTLTVNTVSTATANTSGTGAGSTAVFNFNGGTFKARSANAIIKNSSVAGTSIPITVVVKSGGAIIDSNTFNMSTAEPLQHDATLGATPDGGLSKKNTGTFTLSGVNTYTGNTTILGGSLALSSSTSNNNIGSSPKIIVGDTAANSSANLNVSAITAAGGFQLPSGQTLAGFGSVTGAVSALAGSTVGPGNSIGTLTESTSMALAGTLSIDLNDADPGVVDLLNDAGNLDISGATSTVTFNITGTPSAAAYVFAKYGSLTGTAFGSVNNLPAGYSLDYNYQAGNQIALVASVPEPTALALAAVGLLVLAAGRRTKP